MPSVLERLEALSEGARDPGGITAAIYYQHAALNALPDLLAAIEPLRVAHIILAETKRLIGAGHMDEARGTLDAFQKAIDEALAPLLREAE